MRKFLVFLILALAMLTAGVMFFTKGRTDQKARVDQAAGQGEAAIGGSFTLTDQNGKTVHDSDFRGRLMLVFFGYTHCPDECPATVSMLSHMMTQLGPQADQVAPLFISVDPARDTPAVMKDFLSNFDKRFVGLTGTPEQIRQVAELYKVYYAKAGANGSATIDKAHPDYGIDHSAFLYLMGKDGKFIRLFPYNTPADDLARAVSHILGQ